MVDAQFAPLTDKIVAAIKQISDRADPVHGQHARARRPHRRQRESRQAGRDDPRAREAAQAARRSRPRRQRRARHARRRPPALPVITYDAPITIHMNGEDMQLIPVPVGAHRRRHAGAFPGRRRDHDRRFLPLDRLSEHRPRQRRLAEGHDRRAGRDHRRSPGRTRRSFPATAPIVDKRGRRGAPRHDRRRSRQGRAAGAAREDRSNRSSAAKPTADFDAKVPGVGTTGDRFVGQLYAELKTPPAR